MYSVRMQGQRPRLLKASDYWSDKEAYVSRSRCLARSWNVTISEHRWHVETPVGRWIGNDLGWTCGKIFDGSETHITKMRRSWKKAYTYLLNIAHYMQIVSYIILYANSCIRTSVYSENGDVSVTRLERPMHEIYSGWISLSRKSPRKLPLGGS